MTRWTAWFEDEGGLPTFRVMIAANMETAEMMANDLASRNKIKVIGIIVASEQFNPKEK